MHGEKDERVPLQAVLDWARPQSRALWCSLMAAWSMRP
jgi:hypothetical protein